MFNLIACVLLFLTVLAGEVLADQYVQTFDVIDGDTVIVLNNSMRESVRLIGIDAPEMRENPKAIKDSEKGAKDLNTIFKQGKLSQKHLALLASKGISLKLEFDVEKHDRYDRVLAYLYLPDGRMLNEEMVRSGYANLMTIPPNVRYAERLKKASQDARRNRAGLWATEEK